MPTWRKLHVKVCESGDIADMPDDFTRLMWVLLPTQLCREGRGIDNPSWVRSRVFPLREDVTLKMVTQALDWFVGRGMIVRYQVADRAYFWVPTFDHYQGRRPKEAASEYPPPPTEVMTKSRPSHDQVMTKSSTDIDIDEDIEEEIEIAASAQAPREPDPPPEADVGPVPDPKPKTRRKAEPKPRDPLLDTLAIQAFRAVTERYPKRALFERVVDALGDAPDVPRLRRAYQDWLARGYNPQNVEGWIGWYQNGTPANGPRASPQGVLAAADAEIRAVAQERRGAG